MDKEVIEEFKDKVQKTIDSFKNELTKVRTGRANLQILDGIRINYYGTLTPLNQVASLRVAEPKLITVKPWEKSMIPEIEKAITKANLGLNPQSDAEMVRLPIPSLTEERRKDIVKQVKKTGEDSKVSIRNIRRDSNDDLKDFEKESEITEDQMHKAFTKIQEETDKAIKKVDEILTKKQAEILEI